MNNFTKSFLAFLLTFVLTAGIALADKSCSRTAGEKSLLYPTISRNATGDIELELFGRTDVISLWH